jgi:hypothetical protein
LCGRKPLARRQRCAVATIGSPTRTSPEESTSRAQAGAMHEGAHDTGDVDGGCREVAAEYPAGLA